MLGGLGFAEPARARPLSSFSGGWLMRVELAKLLLSAPDVLLLDEPTNHLDLPSIAWFEETLKEYRGAALDRLPRQDLPAPARDPRGRAGEHPLHASSRAATTASWPRRRSGACSSRRRRARRGGGSRETERFIERFRYKASKARQVQSRVKSLAKLERVELAPESRRSMRLRIPAPVRAGDVVLRLEGVHKRYGETVVYRGVDFLLRRGDRVALAGPNGAGKSTLLRIAAGALGFDAGSRRLGHNVTVAFYAQHQLETLNGSRSVLAELESVASIDDVPRLRGHLGAFLFSGDDVQKQVSVLSGGEKARLALAKMLLRPSNFLVLDEPTNHLDVAACEVLEDALAGYQGTLLFISHDRAFINALATRVVEVRDGVLRDHAGNYDDFERSAAGDGAGSRRAAARRRFPVSRRPPRKSGSRRASRTSSGPGSRRARASAWPRWRQEIAQHESALEQLGWRLGDPEVHRDGDAVRALEGERSELRGRVEALYREWERLAAELEAAQEAVSGALALPAQEEAMPEFCKVERDDRILTVTIARPALFNALHPPANFELEKVFDEFAADPDLWVAIITGEGDRAFCAGNDLKFQAASDGKLALAPKGFAGLTARYDLVKPVIAAVNGVAMGGGFEIALACDLIIASENAVFALPEPRVGLAALAGGMHRLPRQIPLKHAMGMLLTGRRVSAREGFELGFVNEVVPPAELMAAARRWAGEILECAPLSVRASKQCALEGLGAGSIEAAMQGRYDQLGAMLRSEDFVEGPRAFAQKRKPAWKGR